MPDVDWSVIPGWPPDLFAAAATLVNLSGCYTHPWFTGWDRSKSLYTDGYLRTTKAGKRCIRDIADSWLEEFNTDAPTPPEEVCGWLDEVMSSFDEQVYSELPLQGSPPIWHSSAFQLMVVADEVCAGMGFADNDSPLARTVFFEYTERIKGSVRETNLPIHLPHSLCWMVPPDEACVQPKVMTPQVGCTLRSFSHHLALLPTIGEVKTSWIFGRPPSDERKHMGFRERLGFRHHPLNLLLVPFPYSIGADCFHPDEPATGNQVLPDSDDIGGNQHFFFRVTPNWLKALGANEPTQAASLVSFLQDLINQGCDGSNAPPDGLILPEIAMDIRLAEKVADALAAGGQLEFFITGFSGPLASASGDESANDEGSQNGIAIFLFSNKKRIGPYIQHKHHRWKLDSSQVLSYELDTRLNPTAGVYWWEKMTIRPRECYFLVIRSGACLAALDCEDLGRAEPVQQAIRAIGANLVTCLLLDGAQIVQRWPHRYAMVLADDPGSSVLTLTSLGMICRYPKQKPPYSIGLWKERDGGTRQIELEHGNHAVLLTLWPDDHTNFSLDGRSDDGATVKLALSGMRQLRVPSPPKWAEYHEPGRVAK